MQVADCPWKTINVKDQVFYEYATYLDIAANFA